ncbi:MAG: CDGSH iron-sulfur domain-containing protein [Bacteroidales bacterium]|jgi:CDGSH-type Zn-finger protein|nr:CDGSH iron-sulfur domain-containing protein [Bacteroidales bacterium]
MNKEELPEKSMKNQVVVQVSPNGPLYLKGRVTLIDQHGNKFETSDLTAFCRCGGSHKKPFCDGTHNYIEFKD